MTPAEYDKLTGIERLRRAVSTFNAVNETFNDQFTAEELLLIHRMYCLADWDLYPDEWAPRQVAEALRGKAPRWDDQERPVYE